ncbi:hypothetical protein D9M72_369670 [compost metagenome]
MTLAHAIVEMWNSFGARKDQRPRMLSHGGGIGPGRGGHLDAARLCGGFIDGVSSSAVF